MQIDKTLQTTYTQNLNQNQTHNQNHDYYFRKIILTFPIYYKLFEKYYTEGKNISYELNRLYEPIFIGLIEYYTEFMTESIENIIKEVEEKYNPDRPYALIDYIEFIYGNKLYDIFLSEIKKNNFEKIGYEHLCVFEYIIRVELHKYKLYLTTIGKIESGTKILVAFEHRINNCLKKISFCLRFLEKNFFQHTDLINLCRNLIIESNLEDKIQNILIESSNMLEESFGLISKR